MTASNQSIVTCFEELGLTPEQIADAEGVHITAVKSILFQCSGAYRESIKANVELDFTEGELDEANKAIANIMRFSEDDHLRLKAAVYLRDDKKGRKDKKGLQSISITINQMNAHIGQVHKQMALAREKAINNGSTDKSVLGQIKETVDV